MTNQTSPSEPDIVTQVERRETTRVRTVYRVVRIQHNGDEGLARVRNISDGGMKLDIGLPVDLNDTLDVELSPCVMLKGQVVWVNGGECGLSFRYPVDSAQALVTSAWESRAPRARPPRLNAFIPVTTYSERGLRGARVMDLSQRGMKLEHDGCFTPGLQIKVTFSSGIERRGTIRWVNGILAGVLLTQSFTIDELGSIRRLAEPG